MVAKDRNKSAREKFKARTTKTIIIYGEAAHLTTGNSKLIYNMARVFKEAGHIVYNIGKDYNMVQMNYEGWLPILPSFHCENCGNSTRGSVENVDKIARYINLFQPDYFICVGDPYQMQQFGLGKLDFKQNTRSIMYATIDSFGMFTNDLLLMQGLPDYMKKCDKVVATSIYTQEQLKYWEDIDSPLIHETINLDTYSPVDKNKQIELKKKNRFKEKDFVMYYSGRAVMRKRHHILFEAATKFIIETENTYLYVNIPSEMQDDKGNPIYTDTLNPIDFVSRVMTKIYGRNLVEEGRIVFISRGGLGSITIPENGNAELHQLSDLYICSTSSEGFGLVPIESMSCGVPVIVPNNTTAPETIGIDDDGNGIGGIIIDSPIELWIDHNLKQDITTPQKVYEAIVELYNKPELREKLGKQGREYVQKMFNFNMFKDKWLDIIKTTQKRKPVEEGFKTMNMENESKEKPSKDKENNKE